MISREVANASTYEELMAHFAAKLGPRCPLENGYLDWVKYSNSYEEAVYRSCRSIKPNGKKHNHQSKIPAMILEDYAEMLIGRQVSITNAARRNFDAYYDELVLCQIWGIGPLATYDISVRLGEYLGVYPERVYMHAGVAIGLKAMGMGRYAGNKSIDPAILPQELQSLTPNEMEDFLCSYAHLFPQIIAAQKAANV